MHRTLKAGTLPVLLAALIAASLTLTTSGTIALAQNGTDPDSTRDGAGQRVEKSE